MHNMYRKYVKALVLFFPLLMFLPSCIMYHPQTADIPLIEKKGGFPIVFNEISE